MDPFSYALGCSAGTNNPENFYYRIWFLTRLNVSLCVRTENSSWFCVVTWQEGVCVCMCVQGRRTWEGDSLSVSEQCEAIARFPAGKGHV